jgi:predicted PurR-regulated permease PerM
MLMSGQPPDRHPGETRHTQVLRYELSFRTIITIVATIAACWLLIRVWQIILLLVIALVLAGTLSPILAWLERHKIKRPLGLMIVLIGMIALISGLGALVVPALASQISAVVSNAPQMRSQFADSLATIPGLTNAAQVVREAELSGYVATIGGQALTYAAVALQSVFYAIMALVLAIYLLADQERVQGFMFALLPRRYHLRSARVLLDMETIVGGYVRGQALTSILIAVFTWIVLAALGVPNALALAVIAGFADLIPLIGPILAVAPPVLAALTQGPITAIVALVLLVIYNQIENHILIPRVYGQTMRLSPVAVIVSLLVGGALLGVVGALLALPIAAGIRVLIEDLRIELPGEQPGEQSQRANQDEAEARYAEQAEGATAIEAAVMATTFAEQLQEDERLTTGQLETPVEEQNDDSGFESREGASPPSLPNPAR